MKAPVKVLVACVASLIVNAALIVPPAKLLMLAAVTIGDPLIQPSVLRYKLRAPIPPTTCNALLAIVLVL